MQIVIEEEGYFSFLISGYLDEFHGSIFHHKIPRSENFYAVINYGNNQDLNLLPDINSYVAAQNYVTMIVDSTARDYITKEKTEKIAFDGKSFNVISNGTLKYYFTKQYYEFIINEIT